MVIAAFYVIGSDVSAETIDEVADDLDEQTPAIEHLDRRLTISNSGATDPHIIVNGDVTYMIWVDGKIGSQSLMWKCSNDSLCTFTPDTSLTSKFHSIDDISLCCSDGCIAAAFEAKTSSDSPSIIYYLYSSDGQEWSSAYSVAQGDSPVLIGAEGCQYLGMNIVNEGQRRLSIASIVLNDDEINVTILANLPLASDIFDLYMKDDLINIAFYHDSSDRILFMQLAENGTIVTSPATICQTTDLIGVDLKMIGSSLRSLIIEEGSISLGRCLGSPEYWSVCCPLEVEGTITDASMKILDENIRMACAINDGNETSVLYFDCDLQGQMIGDLITISTPGLDACSPVLLSTSPEVISCIYVEEHYDSQELFLRYDMDFVIPDIPRLKKFIGSLDESMLIDGNGSKIKLVEKLDKIIAYLENKNETAAVEEALALKASIEAYFMGAPYADQESIQGSKDKIKKNLDSVKKDDANEVIIMSPPPVPGCDVNLYTQSITNDQAELRMYLVYLGIPLSGYIMWGSSSSSLTNCIGCTLNGNIFNATVTGLDPNSTYYAMGYINASTRFGNTLESSQLLSYRTFPSVLHIYSITVSVSSGSAVICWTTDGLSSSRVDYGITSSYGSYVSSSSSVTAHSLTLSDLASNTLYHYKITSTYSTSGFSLSAITSDRTFTSASAITVTITSVASALTDLDSVRITWTTNVQATSVVYYGTTISYGSTASGDSGTSHTVDISGLTGGALYHYKVRSAATADPNAITYGSDHTFTTRSTEDANLGYDAGDDSSSASLLTPGSFTCYLDSAFDTNDFYSTPLLSGETFKLVMDVPSNFDYDLYLYNPSGSLVASSTNGVGVDESIQYAINANGAWMIRVSHQSGTGQGLYGFDVQVLGAWEHHYLNVGTTGDNDVLAHTPGLAIMDGTGWYAASNSMRETTVNGSFLLNMYDDTYQSNTYYEVAIAYTSTADVGVSVLVGDSWVNVATLPGRSIAWTYSFILKSDMLSDSSSSIFGYNVRMRFDHAVIIDWIDAIPIAYSSDFFGDSPCNPGVMLESNWQLGSAVVNGSTYATLIVSLPRTDITYFLEFQNLDSCDGIGVQQWDGSTYDNIGTLESWGTSAVIQLDTGSYYDVYSTAPGTNLRIRLTSPIVNLTRVVLWTSQSKTDVGVAGDSDPIARLPGVSIYDNGEWSVMTTLDSRTVRNTVQGASANFLLNGALSDTSYIISICYKATTGAASLYQYKGSAYGGYVSLGSLVVDGQWHTTLFATSAENVYDYVTKGQTNIIFWISSSYSVAVDSITVCRDSDGDGYSDALESLRITQSAVGTHVYDLNPFSADTDSDGLNDIVERTTAYNTDPCDPDTDSDGLLDGSEKYSYTWSTDDSYLIPDNGTVLDIAISIPSIQGGTSGIASFCLVLGIMHESQYQIEVKIAKGTGTQKVIKAANTGSGANYFILRNLFTISSPYAASDLSSANVWHIYVRDVSSSGEKGRVEYARLQVNGTTLPLVGDTDGDGMLDGEEVEFGTDGWMTNPRSADSDSDGVSDGYEITGSTVCGSATDPTRADTDDDGYNDNIDRYMGDAVLRVTMLNYTTLDTINGQDTVDVFFVINYQDEEQEFATKRISATKNVLYTLNWIYDIDIPETAEYVNVEFEAVAENCGYWPGNDVQLDIDGDSTNKFNANWEISSTPFIGYGTDSGGSYDAYLKVQMERAVAEKAKVIVINGTGDDGDYGLDTVSAGVYRYSADDQVYLIDLNVSSSNGRFQQGMNTIILPRAIALQCQLNDTLYDLASLSTGDPLYGASFYSTDPASTSASAHVIAVISKDVTATQAELILTKLTHNSTGARIGNNVTISSTALYLLHLPNDILSTIPTFVKNAGMGEGPNYLNPLGIISDIAGMAFDFLVWVASGGLLLLFVHLVEMGLEAIGNLLAAAAAAVQDAVDAIVDAFNAFIDWVIDLMVNYLETLFSPLIENIENAIESYGQEVNHAFSNAEQNVVAFGSVSSETLDQLYTALTSDLFILMLGIGISIQILLKTLTVLTMGASFLITVLVSVAVGYIVNEIIKSDQFDKFTGSICNGISGLYDWMEENFGPGENPPSNVQIAWSAFGFCMSVVGIVYSLWGLLGELWSASVGFAFGVASVIFGTISTCLGSFGLAYLGIAMGAISISCGIHSTIFSTSSDEIIVGLIATSFGGIGLFSSWEATL